MPHVQIIQEHIQCNKYNLFNSEPDERLSPDNHNFHHHDHDHYHDNNNYYDEYDHYHDHYHHDHYHDNNYYYDEYDHYHDHYHHDHDDNQSPTDEEVRSLTAEAEPGNATPEPRWG